MASGVGGNLKGEGRVPVCVHLKQESVNYSFDHLFIHLFIYSFSCLFPF